MDFARLGLPPALVAALAKQGIDAPTPIQAAAIPVLRAGRSAYLNAETGTGKTLAYLLPVFERLDPAQPAAQAIVMAPTHELAIQIHRVACALAQDAGLAVRSLLLIGGTSLERQIDKLKTKPHVLVGSPGRMRELIAMKKLKPAHVRWVVVDEADRLLARESAAEVRAVAGACAPDRQMVFASATESPEAGAAAAALAPGLEVLRAGSGAVNADIEHLYLVCEERDKVERVRKLVRALEPGRALVFVHRNTTAADVAATLAHHKIEVADLHGARDKLDRQRALDAFRSGRARVLVASDLAARGLHVEGVTHVFNLDVPTASPAYLHRVGRTGRAGTRGVAITLVTHAELRRVARTASELGIRMRQVRLREGALQLVDEDAAGE